MPKPKTRRALYATEAAAGAAIGGVAMGNRVPEMVNGTVRLKRKADAWHAKTRYEAGLGKTPDGKYVKLESMSDKKPPKPPVQFTPEGKPFTPKYDKKSPKVAAAERSKSDFLETKARAEHPNHVPFPEGKWERYRVSGRKIRFKPAPGGPKHAKPKMVRTPAALGELRRNTVIAAGVPLGIALGWHGAHKYAGEKDKQRIRQKARLAKRLDRNDADGAIAGGLIGASAYHAPSFMEWGARKKMEDKYTAEQLKTVDNWKTEYGVHGAQKGDRKWKKAYRNYPTTLPDAKLRRAMAHTHVGLRGMALTGGAGLAGAAVGVPTVRLINRKTGKKRVD